MSTVSNAPVHPACDARAPHMWHQRSLFGDLALVLFLLAQCFDGVFTYVGVTSFGIGVEANPIIAMLMLELGHGTGLLSAKVVAALLGIALHLRQVHGAVALLTLFYTAAAIVPWMVVLSSW